MIGPSQRPLADNTQHSQETNVHNPSVIRTRNPNKLAAVDQRLRPHGHWDPHILQTGDLNGFETNGRKQFSNLKCSEFVRDLIKIL
jgi:hypothetical protein